MKSEILLEESSPYGNILAVVEDSENTVYFTLYGPKNIIPLGESPDSWKSMRSCWVCNTTPVQDSDVIDMNEIVATMQKGLAPPMPAKHCKHARTGLKIDKDQLEIVWFEEVDCAALLHRGEIMAVIPPWATPSFSDYTGYAKEFKGEPFLGIGSLEEILPDIEKRIKRAKNFWLKWSQPETWGNFLDAYMKILETHFGANTRYFAIDGGHFPPKALTVFENENTLFFITIGMSIFAQPRVELYVQQPEQFRRIELGMAVDKATLTDVSIEKIGGFISRLASMPWNQLCWFGHGQTLYNELFKNYQFNNVLFVDRDLDSVILPDYEDDPIKLLWLIPITDKELAYQQEHSAEDLINKLESSQNSWICKPRSSVV
jgi:Suppressor of fused protein (SUFU)